MKLSSILWYLAIENKFAECLISSIQIDSRKVTKGAMFLALKGLRVHGRDYIQDAITNGAVAVLIAPCDNITSYSNNIPIIVVDDLANKAGALISFFYGDPSQHTKVIGITGTNGKTSISHYIAQLNRLHCGIIGTLGMGVLDKLVATNNTTPDCCVLQQQLNNFVNNHMQLVAMEVSSHALAQKRVTGTQFAIAIFTNLTPDHLDYHHNIDKYYAIKK